MEPVHCSFFQNRQCEYFPCHPTDDPANFNCLFCFCPLYGYEDCGGRYTYTRDGVKDCSNCLLPHRRESYALMMRRLRIEADNKKEAPAP